MNAARPLLLVAFWAMAMPLWAQAAPPPTPASVMNDPVQGGWRSDDLQQSIGQWQHMVQQRPADQQARLNLFRSERNASMARNAGHIPATDQARLESITHDMAVNDATGFETQIALFHLHFPHADAWSHLQQATLTGTGRMELIGPQLVNAARSGNEAALMRHGKELLQRGGVAPGLLAMADDILLSVETNAVLIAAGEMDAYPTWARQYGAGQRRDVLVVDQRLLNDATYRQHTWKQADARGSVPATADAFMERLPRSTQRPVYLSLALGPERLSPWSAKLYVTGLAARYSDVPYDNATALAANWPRMGKALNAGPLSNNYLLPASILLKHYRSIALEEGYAPLEHELRQMARTLGATERLYRTGVLEH